MTRIVRIALTALAITTLTACAPDSGTVTSRTAKGQSYVICVSDGEESGCEPVDASTYAACDVGERWPDCKAHL